MDNKKLIFKTTQEHLAHLIKGLLESQGIRTLMLNQKDSSYTVFGEIELYVSNADEETAKSIIKENSNE
jgi:hypothetical protein